MGALIPMIHQDDLLVWIRKLQHVYAENRDYLTDLDAAIGDAEGKSGQPVHVCAGRTGFVAGPTVVCMTRLTLRVVGVCVSVTRMRAGRGRNRVTIATGQAGSDD